MKTIELEVVLELIVCCACGMSFGVPEVIVRARRRDHQSFYCPSGHAQCFPGESDIEKLKRELKATREHAREMREWGEQEVTLRRSTERRLSATRAAHTRTKNRIANGVCPCCNRHFENLQGHMSTQHPSYVSDDGNDPA